MAKYIDQSTLARAYYRVNSSGDPLDGNSVGGGNLNAGQVQVGTTANLIAAARTGRGAITVTNITGAQKIYIGNAGVTLTTGALLPAAVGATITIPFTGAVYGIAETAAQTVSFYEVY